MKDKIFVYLFMFYIITFFSLHIIFKDNNISISERRTLSTFPKLTISNEYIKDIETYMLEHFPYRDKFRNIKANYNYKILNKLDNNNIYIEKDNIYKSNYPTNKKSIDYFINNINKTKEQFNETNNVYLMIIPDKNYYLDNKLFLHIDYDYIYSKINELNINNIDIRNILNKNDYYKTDTHWKQENLNKVIKHMNSYMNFNYIDYSYKKNTFDKFYGVYYGESALKTNPETITYLSNNILDNVNVSYLENNKLNKIYNLDKLNSFDPYEVYLDGASSFIEIKNELSTTDKELIIFRDSFASSITPLLVPYYKKITIIDNRYINSNNYLNYIKYDNQDIIFMYSTLIINNSLSLKG